MRKETIRKNDFTNTDLPLTRVAQFFDVFKHQFLSLLKVSLLQFVFAMPLFLLAFFYHYLIQATDSNSTFSVIFYLGLGSILCTSILFVGLSGSFYYAHNIVLGNGIIETSNFFMGIKQNGLKTALLGLIEGISFFVGFVGSTALLYFDSNDTVIVGLGIALSVIQFIVITITIYYALGQLVSYETKLGQTLKNSFLFTLIRFPQNLLLVLFTTVLVVFCMIFLIYSYYAILAIYLLFSSSIHLMWMLLTTSTFDKFINKEQYPDFYRKGLQKETN